MIKPQLSIVIPLGIALAIIIWYALAGRAWLKSKPWAAGFFRVAETAEIWLYKKSETILVGRLLWVGGLLVTMYDAIAMFAGALIGVDLTPLTGRLFSFVPEDLRPIVVSSSFAGIGLLINWLRKRTTKPMELVEITDEEASHPEVAQAIAEADKSKVEAVVKIEEAKVDKVIEVAGEVKEALIEVGDKAGKETQS